MYLTHVRDLTHVCSGLNPCLGLTHVKKYANLNNSIRYYERNILKFKLEISQRANWGMIKDSELIRSKGWTSSRMCRQKSSWSFGHTSVIYMIICFVQ